MRLLYVNGCAVPVTEDVYRAYWQETEKARYGDKCWREKTCRPEGIWATEYPHRHRPLRTAVGASSAEAVYLGKERRQALYDALCTLPEGDRADFIALLLGEVSERALAEKRGVSRSAVNRWRHRHLRALRHILSKSM